MNGPSSRKSSARRSAPAAAAVPAPLRLGETATEEPDSPAPRASPPAKPRRGRTPSRHRREKRSQILLNVLDGGRRLALVTHNNPDPDAIASSMAVRRLITARLDVPVDIVCRNPPRIGENRVIAQVCGFSDAAVTAPDWTLYDRVVLIDTQPATGFHCVPNEVAITACIDHHGTGGRLRGVQFRDVRQSFGATASIVTSYLIEQDLDIDPSLGASLLFGIEVDTGGLAGVSSHADDVALSRLHLVADKALLAQMRYARLPQPYYEAFLHGLLAAFAYDDCVIAYLGDLETPEMTAIVADFLLRLEDARRVLCLGSFQNGMTLSLRVLDPDDEAGKKMAALVRGYGTGGGHRAKAGGRIPYVKGDADTPREVYDIIRRRFLRLMRAKANRGRRLVQKRHIVAAVEWQHKTNHTAHGPASHNGHHGSPRDASPRDASSGDRITEPCDPVAQDPPSGRHEPRDGSTRKA